MADLPTETVPLDMLVRPRLWLQAVQAFERLLRSDGPRARLRAARLALSFGFRVLEDQDINERPDILESAVHTLKGRNGGAF